MGDRFGLDRSKACANVHKLLPVLIKALDKAGVLLKRKFESVEELHAAFAGIADLISLTAPFRNHKDNLADDVALVTAGLANWMLSVHNASPA